jgi:hypothetical protein
MYMFQNFHRFLLQRQVVTKSWSLLFATAAILVAALVALMNFFNPSDVGPNGLLLFFTLLYGLCFVVMILLLKVCRVVFRRKIHSIKLLYLASIIAFAPVMLLALNTLNQLETLDVALVVIFEALALFYVIRRIQ